MDATGRRLTNYNCYLGFYDFTRIQGIFPGTLSKVLGLSNITHVGPIIETPKGNIAITICAARYNNGRYIQCAKLHKEEVLQRSGVTLVAKIPIGTHAFDLGDVMDKAEHYTDASIWDVIFHALVGRWIGLTRPRMCTTFACELFSMKDEWHPATLYRRLMNDYAADSRTS